jgi:hypothetical protein
VGIWARFNRHDLHVLTLRASIGARYGASTSLRRSARRFAHRNHACRRRVGSRIDAAA